MAKLVLSYLSCYILKCLRPDSFRKSCDVRTCSFTFQSPIHLGRSASWTRVLLSHLFIFSQQLTYYQLKLSEMFTDGIFFFRHNWFPCLLLVRAKDLQCGQSRLAEENLLEKAILQITNIYFQSFLHQQFPSFSSEAKISRTSQAGFLSDTTKHFLRNNIPAPLKAGLW